MGGEGPRVITDFHYIYIYTYTAYMDATSWNNTERKTLSRMLSQCARPPDGREFVCRRRPGNFREQSAN